MGPKSLKRYAWLSIAAALSTILLKGIAWRLTDSVGLLSDAIESFVNLAGALMALGMLSLAARPADDSYAHGHGKAEYFSSAFEGFLIVVAAVWIATEAVGRLMNPRPIEAVSLGLGVAVLATIVNFATARILMTVGRTSRSIALEADARHLLTDVWTSIGVIMGVALVWLTGWLWLDPIIALLVAANIVWTGWQLLRRSAAFDGCLAAAFGAGADRGRSGYLSAARIGVPRSTHPTGRYACVYDITCPGSWCLDGPTRTRLVGAN
jgi:cation diffusion facilitator family transporter